MKTKIAHQDQHPTQKGPSRSVLVEQSFAHHYGAVGRIGSAERKLRSYPPLAWGVIKHVGRGLRRSEQRLEELHLARMPLTL